jgi:TonB family protein
MTLPRLAFPLLLALLPAAALAQEPAAAPKLSLVPLSAPKPVIPDAACQQRLSGWVEVEFAVLPDGRVAEARVLKSQPAGTFDAAAVASINGRLYAAQGAPVKMRERVLMTYADCRSEQLKVAPDAAAGQLSAQECIALATEGRASGERFGLIDSGRAILAGTVAQVYAAPSAACPVIGKTLKPGARWRAHLEHKGYSLISPLKGDEAAAVWVRSGDLKDVDVSDLVIARGAPSTPSPPPATPPPAAPVAPVASADAKALLALHEDVLRAHVAGNVEPKSTRFSIYRDQVPPTVKVSADGTLGWVIAQIEAKGEQAGADGQPQQFEYVRASVELYEKRGGKWVAAGTAANFKP